MRVFIDTNIFLDILCRREQFSDDALSIFDLAVDDRIELLISDLSIANMRVRQNLAEKFGLLENLLYICSQKDDDMDVAFILDKYFKVNNIIV